jgi:hypothetical protein
MPWTARIPLGSLALLGLLGPALAGGIEVSSDPQVDFTKYSTYTWGKGTEAAQPQAQERIVSSIERELAERGLHKVDEGADLIVVSHAFAASSPTVSARGIWYVAHVDIGEARDGTLWVDVLDAGSQKTVWRGAVEKAVEGKPDRILDKIDKIVDRMFAKFPIRR